MDEMEVWRQYTQSEIEDEHRQIKKRLLQGEPWWKRPFLLLRHGYKMRFSESYKYMHNVGSMMARGFKSGIEGSGPPMPLEVQLEAWRMIRRSASLLTFGYLEHYFPTASYNEIATCCHLGNTYC